MQKSPHTINLVGNARKNFVDKFINWALSAGRMIIIFTEVVALSAFVYRFGLDRQLIDLHAQINQEQNTVKFFKTQEDTYRNLQERIAAASSLAQTTQERSKIIQNILNYPGEDVIFNTISLSDNKIQIGIQVHAAAALSNFVERIKKFPQVTAVSIDTIESKPSTSTLAVSISMLVQK